MESYIFLSYSHKDTREMHSVKNTLSHFGLQIWTDEKIKMGTPNWEITIENRIAGANSFLILLSPDAKVSEWVRLELGYAKVLGKPIYPILIKGNEKTAIPMNLIRSQWADLREENFNLEPIIQELRTRKTQDIQQWMEEVAANKQPQKKLVFDKRTKKLVLVESTAKTTPDIESVVFTEEEVTRFGGGIENITTNKKPGNRLIFDKRTKKLKVIESLDNHQDQDTRTPIGYEIQEWTADIEQTNNILVFDNIKKKLILVDLEAKNKGTT